MDVAAPTEASNGSTDLSSLVVEVYTGIVLQGPHLSYCDSTGLTAV